MVDVTTPTIRLTEPAVGGDLGPTWANILVADLTYIDQAINQDAEITIPDANVVLLADGSSGDQARYAAYEFTGALTADRTVTLPSNEKLGWAINNTTGGHNVILSAGGTTLPCPPGTWTFFQCDGTNVNAAPANFVSLTAGAGGSFASSIGSSGYQKLPGGLIEQWGSGVTGAGTGGALVTFPIPFPAAVLNVTATVSGGASGGAFITFDPGFTLTQITFYAWISQNTQLAGAGFSWRAIGN